jgi:hypothetical protein
LAIKIKKIKRETGNANTEKKSVRVKKKKKMHAGILPSGF